MGVKLTIGMACYDDYDGVWFSVQALRLYHREILPECELIIVDNHPSSPHGEAVRNFITGWVKGDFANARYIPMKEPVGPANAKDRVFREAVGEMVLCMDSHVLIPPGELAELWLYRDFANHLLSGPMVYDDLKNCSTHFDDVWRGEMWGTWGTDPQVEQEQPFEIGANGLGLFACRKDAWEAVGGFNPNFRGFGGEEWYIHTKFRQHGRKCLCLPFLRWVHRFGRPNGVQYPLTRWNKVRNYIIGHTELGLPLDRIKEHFIGGNLMTLAEWEILTANPSNPPEEPPKGNVGGCGTCGKGSVQGKVVKAARVSGAPATLEQLYQNTLTVESELKDFLPYLRNLASDCGPNGEGGRVVSLERRLGLPTIALLAGQPKYMLAAGSVAQPNEWSAFSRLAEKTALETKAIEKTATFQMPDCDMLFVNTGIDHELVYQELYQHHLKVSRWIVIPFTHAHGYPSKDGPGLLEGIRRFLRDAPQWTVKQHVGSKAGITVLTRDPAEQKKVPGLWQRGKNYASSTAHWIAKGAPVVTEAQHEARLKVCDLCILRVGGHCSACGCPLEAKAARATDDCPFGYWPKLDVKMNKANREN